MSTDFQPQDRAARESTEQAAQRARELNDQLLEAGRQANLAFLDAYERGGRTWADWQERVADQAQVDWIANVARAQATFTREASRVYATTARDLLKR